MDKAVEVQTPAGCVLLRPETAQDEAFRYVLFCNSRPPEWSTTAFPPGLLEQLMRQQFAAQTASYRAQFPHARFDIIELDQQAIGRIVVDRPGDQVHIVDQAITPALRNRGIGSAVMRFLMREAAEAGLPVKLKVASSNDPSLQLYLRLGFRAVEETPMYLDMAWSAPVPAS